LLLRIFATCCNVTAAVIQQVKQGLPPTFGRLKMERAKDLGCALLGSVMFMGLSCSSSNKASTDGGGLETAASGIPVVNGYLTLGPLQGTVGTRVDGCGSTVTLSADSLCAVGNVIVNANTAGCSAWGAAFGMYANQPLLVDGGQGTPAGLDLSAYTTMVVGISGGAGLTLRVAFEQGDADAGTAENYCAALPSTGTPSGGMPLSSLKKSCWELDGEAFDPATMRPTLFGFTILSDPLQNYPYDICITEVSFH